MWKTVFQSRLVTIGAVAGIVFFGFTIAKRLPELERARSELARTEQKLLEAEAERIELETSRNSLQSESYLERQARLRLNYKKEGEEVVYVYRKDAVPEPALA